MFEWFRRKRNVRPAPEAGQRGQKSPRASHLGRSGQWSRRRFLGGALTGIGAFLAGCTRPPQVTPTPTKTPLLDPRGQAQYNQFLPLVSNRPGATATPIPSATPEPTLTPTPPKGVAVAQPQPTPTPRATPFPPGPPSKLGLFVTRNEPQMFRLLQTQGVAVVKTLELDANFVAQIKQWSPHTKVIGRIDLPQLQLSQLRDPSGAARAFVEQLLPIADDPARRPHFDGWEAYNEPVAGNADEMKRLAEFEAERTRLLGERGIRSVIANFGTGQPPLELWEYFLPAIQEALNYDGWLGLHEYSAPTMYYLTTREGQGRNPDITPQDTGWLTLRYRHVYNRFLKPRGLVIPLVMTELGIDGLVTERPGPRDARGWVHFQDYWAQNGYGQWGPGAYVEQLVWYDRAMQQDDYVIGGCIYALAASQGWQSYEIFGEVVDILEQYFSVHAYS